ncbi:MAG: TolC family protein [Phycisphaerae bacterium]|nr:TolC family protein [Phycisphaerae bacterium]
MVYWREGDTHGRGADNVCARGRRWRCILLLALMLVVPSGCKSPTDYRMEADNVAYDIVQEKQDEALGQTERFTIVRYSDLLRHRLIACQNLPVSMEASSGVPYLAHVEHWPDPNYLVPRHSPDVLVNEQRELDPLSVLPHEPVRIGLMQALQIGAYNNFNYQKAKEDVFARAMDLDLQRHFFRFQYAETIAGELQYDNSDPGNARTQFSGASRTSVTKRFANGVDFGANLVLNMVDLLTGGGPSAVGLRADASVSVPLLQGSGRHIRTFALTNAEQAVVYQIYDFNRFRQSFATQVAAGYLGVLGQADQIKNAEENYRRLMMSVRRARRLADAGQLTEIQVDQAVQDELSARERWIGSLQSYQNSLDDFKQTLGLPVDARVELDGGELDRLTTLAQTELLAYVAVEETGDPNMPMDAPVVFEEPGYRNPGRLEMDAETAVRLGLANRLDLRRRQGEVHDKQRAVVFEADRLRGKLTIGADVNLGRGVNSAFDDNSTQLRFDRAAWTFPLAMELPLERTAERNNYRQSLISLEQAIRTLASTEDQIKSEIRSQLRRLLSSRESLQISAQGVDVARKRVESTDLFLQAGRAQIRDVLEAQRSLLSAQNALTSAVVNYRIAELNLQRDMGLLQVDENGLWREFVLEDVEQ